jgi:hypothetical protein
VRDPKQSPGNAVKDSRRGDRKRTNKEAGQELPQIKGVPNNEYL